MAFRKIYPGQKDPNQNGAKEFVDAYLGARKLRNDKIASDREYQISLAKARREGGEKGFTEEGTIDEDYFTPGTSSYKRGTRASELEQMGRTTKMVLPSNQPSYRQVFSGRGLPLPKEFEDIADQPMDHRFLGMLPTPVKPTESMLSDEIAAARAGKPGIKVPAPFAGAIRPESSSSALATPEQQAAYEQMMNLPKGSAQGFTRQQISGGFSNVRGQEAAGERQGKALDQSARHFDKADQFKRDKATMEGRTKLSEGIGGLERLKDNIDTATKMNPSGADYYRLKAKSLANTATFGGMVGGELTKFTSADQARLDYYNTLSQDSIRTLFESGGKALTETEKRLAGELAIQPTDSMPQILAKRAAVLKYASSKFNSQLDELDRVNPGANEDIRERLNFALEGLEGAGAAAPAASKNPSAARAESAKRLGFGGKGGPAILDAIDDPADPAKNKAGTEAHKKAAPRLYGQKAATDQGQPKKFYSKSRNKTKFVYPDGREEVKDGKH